ncbi:MAG TPA: hypothetical protein VK888_09315, partial [Anaerolineales bacterium]|nr:hypothetical protein [Anaerolineales bacterium]
IYTCLHEAGQAIAGLLFGQSLTEFDVSFWDLSAHVGMSGGELTQTQLAIRAVAGASLPLIVWAIFISLVPRKAGFSLEVLKFLSSMTVVNTLLVWIVLPILYLLGNAPPDDVTNFLRYSRMPPVLLSVTALILYVRGWSLFLSKIDGLRNEFLLLSTTDPRKLLNGAGKTIPVMAGLMAFCILIAFALNGFDGATAVDPFSPPEGFDLAARIDLSTQPYSNETLAQFTLTDPTLMGVFIAVRDINTQYFDLSLTGPDDVHATVLHGEEYNAERDGGLWEQNLQPGTYRIVLTSRQSPGNISLYINDPK